MRAALILLLGAHLLLFGVFYAGPAVLLSRDLPFHHFPLKSMAAQQWREGHIPFWDIQGNCGQPLLANPSASALYPPLWALGFLPGLKTFTIVLIVHHLWMLLGAFLLARSMLGDPRRALVPALLLGFAGPILGALPFANPFMGMAWLPWALLGHWKFAHSGRGAWLALSGASFAFSILAGFDFAPILFPAALAVLALAGEQRRRGLLAAGLAVLLGLLLAAAQILPTAAYLPHARRADPMPYAQRAGFFSFHPLRSVELLVPGVLGWQDPASGAVAGERLADRGTGLFQMPYLGMGAALLLLAGGGWRRAERWWWIAGVAALLLAFGRFAPVHRLVHALPGLGAFRFPEKYLLFLPVAAFFLAVEAARRERTPRALAPWAPAVVLGLALAADRLMEGGLLAGLLRSATTRPLQDPGPTAVLRVATALAVALLGAAVLTLVRSPRVRDILLPVLIAGDLILAPHPGLQPADPGWTSVSPLVRELTARGCSRLVVWDAPDGKVDLPRVESVPGAIVQEQFRTLFPLSGVAWGIHYAFTDLIDEMDPRMLPRALTGDDLRAFGVSQAIWAGGGGELEGAERLDFPGGALFTMAGPVTPFWFHPQGGAAPIPLFPVVERPAAGEIRLTVHADGSGTLRVGETGLPGWHVRVDGMERPAVEPGFPGLSIPLPAGDRRIVCSYRAPGWPVGLALTGAGLALGLIICLWKKRPAFG